MKELILVMLAKEENHRIDLTSLLQLPYFSAEKQLRFYHLLSTQILNYDEK
jgi:hypothetical protein